MATSGVSATANIIEKGETPLITQVMREFKGVNTRSERSAIPEDTFYDLQNVMPIGNANLHTVPGLSAALYNFASQNIYAAQFGMVASIPYLFCYSTQGQIIAYNLNSQTAASIGSGLSGSATRMAPFYNLYALFIDSTGYYSWDGTTFSTLSLANGPSQGTDIAVFAGSVWVSQGRLILVSVAYAATMATDPTQNSAWETVNGATFLVMTDPSLVGNISRLWPQNGFLYIFGPTCVWALTDVIVPTGAVPPTPVWTLLQVQGIVGTDQPFSVFPLNRALMFATRYGVWAIEGVNATELSSDIDGTWQYLTFGQGISGGQAIVLNKLNAAFLITRANDPILGSGNVVAMWFDNKWWFANIGTSTFIVAAVVNAKPTLFAIVGNELYEMFDTAQTVPPNTQVMTPMWAFNDPLSLKQCLRAGFDVITSTIEAASTVTATLDTFNGSSSLPVASSTGILTFVNGAGAALTFTGVGSAPITWITNSYQLYEAAAPAMYSPFVGMTIKTSGLAYELNGFYMDVKTRRRW